MYNQAVNPEQQPFLNRTLSRRALFGAAAGVFLAERSPLQSHAEEDPHVVSYRVFLTESFNGVKSQEGKFTGRFDMQQMAEIGYGFARTIIDNQDSYEVDFAREDFSLSSAENVLRVSGKAHVKKDIFIGSISGDVNFAVNLTSSPEGKLAINYDAMEVDGTDGLALLDLEPKVRDRIGDDPNAKFLEYLNKAYKNEFEEEDIVGDAKIFIGDGFVGIELVGAEQAATQ